MRKWLFIFILLVGLLPSTVVAQSNRLSQDQINQIIQSVVMLIGIQGNELANVVGSGTIVDPSGVIFTNDHVIENMDAMLVLMINDIGEVPQPRYIASITQAMPDADFAVLQIEADADGNPVDPQSLNLSPIPLSPLDPSLGDDIFVFGFPTLGDGYIVLTSGRITTVQNGTVDGMRLPVWYQTDAEISPGNSGGLAVNLNGEMIGIPTAVSSEERTGGRLAGLIPLSTVAALLDIQRDQQYAAAQPADQQQPPQPPAQQQQQQQPPAQQQQPPSTVNTLLDYTLQPNYGGMVLSAGFLPDPFSVAIISGGDVNTGSLNLGAGCLGFATAQPDYRLQWDGQSQGIRLFFVGSGNTSLLINDSRGAWHCSDDSFNTFNPTVDLLNPTPGQFDIWVGSVNPGENVSGTLYITERGSATPLNPMGN